MPLLALFSTQILETGCKYLQTIQMFINPSYKLLKTNKIQIFLMFDNVGNPNCFIYCILMTKYTKIL